MTNFPPLCRVKVLVASERGEPKSPGAAGGETRGDDSGREETLQGGTSGPSYKTKLLIR